MPQPLLYFPSGKGFEQGSIKLQPPSSLLGESFQTPFRLYDCDLIRFRPSLSNLDPAAIQCSNFRPPGLGPTRDISPFRILKICGSSSKWIRRISFPDRCDPVILFLLPAGHPSLQSPFSCFTISNHKDLPILQVDAAAHKNRTAIIKLNSKCESRIINGRWDHRPCQGKYIHNSFEKQLLCCQTQVSGKKKRGIK